MLLEAIICLNSFKKILWWLGKRLETLIRTNYKIMWQNAEFYQK